MINENPLQNTEINFVDKAQDQSQLNLKYKTLNMIRFIFLIIISIYFANNWKNNTNKNNFGL